MIKAKTKGKKSNCIVTIAKILMMQFIQYVLVLQMCLEFEECGKAMKLISLQQNDLLH